MTTYEVTAWCSFPHYTTFELEAVSLAEALEKAKIQARDEGGEPCSGGSEWDEFEISSDDDDSEIMTHVEPSRLTANAAPNLLAALLRFEAAWRSWADDMRRYPKLAASTEMFAIYEQARAAIAEATPDQGRAP